MSDHPSASLEWLAFQYVNDELPEAESAQFEIRLAVDQAAREAVAEAMLLVQAISAGSMIESAALAPQRQSWLQPAAWSALGAAVCLALVLVLRSLPADSRVTARPQAADVTSAELALVWARSETFDDPAVIAEAAIEEELGLATDAREAEREFVVPAWMLEVLSGAEDAAVAPKASQES